MEIAFYREQGHSSSQCYFCPKSYPTCCSDQDPNPRAVSWGDGSCRVGVDGQLAEGRVSPRLCSLERDPRFVIRKPKPYQWSEAQ